MMNTISYDEVREKIPQYWEVPEYCDPGLAYNPQRMAKAQRYFWRGDIDFWQLPATKETKRFKQLSRKIQRESMAGIPWDKPLTHVTKIKHNKKKR